MSQDAGRRRFSSRMSAMLAGGQAIGLLAALLLAILSLVLVIASSPLPLTTEEVLVIVSTLLTTMALVFFSAIIAFPLGLGLAVVMTDATRAPLGRSIERTLVAFATMPTILTGVAALGWYIAFIELRVALPSPLLDWGLIGFTMMISIVPRFALQIVRRIGPIIQMSADAADSLALRHIHVVMFVALPAAPNAIVSLSLRMLARGFGVTAPFLLLKVTGVGTLERSAPLSLASYQHFTEGDWRLACLLSCVMIALIISLVVLAYRIDERRELPG
jgi:ABC-type phosphate transport system permease subunit